MLQQFIDYLQNHISLNKKEVDFIYQTLNIIQIKRGDFILKEQQISKAFYFNLKGCVRLFYMVDGMEKTAFFYTQHQFISSYKSFVKQLPAEHNLQAIKDTQLVVISHENAYKLLAFSPKFEVLSRIMMEEELMIYQDIIASFITQNPEQRYLHFLKNYPQLVQNVAQHYIASYLGVSPESLSRIKKRIAKKAKNLT